MMCALWRWRSITWPRARRPIEPARVRIIAAALLAMLLATPAGRGEDAPQKLEYRGIHIDKVKRTATFPAEINMKEGLLEYLIVADTGKTHESLLSTKIQPYDIQVAMLLLGVAPAAKTTDEPPAQINADYLHKEPPLKGAQVTVSLDWKDKAGSHHEPAGNLIWNTKENKAMTEGPWTYNGSGIYDGKFMAQVDGSVGALVRDPAALFNNPRPGNDDDQIWKPNTKAVPPVGTPVNVTLKMEQAK